MNIFARTYDSFRRRGVLVYVFGFLLGVALIVGVHYISKKVFGTEHHVESKRSLRTPPVNQTLIKGESLRILCLILASSKKPNETHAINQTWVKRCTKHFFVYGAATSKTIENDRMLLPVAEGNEHLTAKILYALKWSLELFGTEFDWILKAEDDTFVIMENLRFMLSDLHPQEPAYLGLAKKNGSPSPNGYNSGSAFVLNHGALEYLGKIAFRSDGCQADGFPDDINLTCLLRAANVPVLNTLEQKERGHDGQTETPLSPLQPYQLYNSSSRGAQQTGNGCCSQYAICLHDLIPEQLFVVEHILYYTRVYKKRKEPSTGPFTCNSYALNPNVN